MGKKHAFILILFSLICCKQARENTDRNRQYRWYHLANTGWKSKSIIHGLRDLEYKATLVPLPYYIMKNGPKDHPDQIDSILQSHRNERIIEMEFAHQDQKDLLLSEFTKRDYEASVKYIAFGITKDFQVLTKSGDTIACSGVTFERNFKLAPFKRILLHFGNIPPEENIELLYEDHLFGNGLFKFNFRETPIQL